MPRKIPQILTVDDDAVTCELLCEVFAREGFGAVCFYDRLGDLREAPI